MIIAVDFDGTIVEHEYPNIGKEKELAIKTLKALQNNGHKVIIWTCRTGVKEREARWWLSDRGFVPDAINKNTEGNLALHDGIDNRKVYANIYLDDKSFPPFPGWPEFYKWARQQKIIVTKMDVAREEFKKRYNTALDTFDYDDYKPGSNPDYPCP